MMKLATLGAAIVLATVLGGAVSGRTAEEEATVRVALLDMSSNAGMGPVGQAMMGPGMGSRMMGSEMMGSGMMGPGMMGYNPSYPMGMMSIRTDQSTLKAGKVKFEVTNWSTGTVHDILVIAVDSADAKLPYDFVKAQVIQDQVKVLAEAAEMQPNESTEIEADLSPGTYMLICNVPGHYAAGMAVAISVTP